MEEKRNNNFPVYFNTLNKMAKIKFLMEGKPNLSHEVTVVLCFSNEKNNYAVVTTREIPHTTGLKSSSGIYKTQFSVTAFF